MKYFVVKIALTEVCYLPTFSGEFTNETFFIDEQCN